MRHVSVDEAYKTAGVPVPAVFILFVSIVGMEQRAS